MEERGVLIDGVIVGVGAEAGLWVVAGVCQWGVS